MIYKIGETAGKIWEFLNENGAVSISKLKKSIDDCNDLIMQGVGWLAREDKIKLEKKGRTTFISLK